MIKHLIDYWHTPQVTALEYEEQRDLELHPDKQGKYDALIKSRTQLGKDFETKAPSKKKKRRKIA